MNYVLVNDIIWEFFANLIRKEKVWKSLEKHTENLSSIKLEKVKIDKSRQK